MVRGELLGEGTFGRVFQGMYKGKTDGTDKKKMVQLPPKMAIKVVKAGDPRLMLKIKHECDLLKTLDHPNIVKYYGCLMDVENKEASIFLEYMPRSLQYLYRNFSALNDVSLRLYTKQILEALAFIHGHEQRIMHGDLKAANILHEGGTAKLSDFGDSRLLGEPVPGLSASQSGVTITEIKGSILWMAPENFN